MGEFPTQAQVLAWVAERWPDHTQPVWRAMKMGEEAGEVLGAVVKSELGLKPASQIAVETAQTVLCAMSLAESVGFDLWEAIVADWETMKTRVWKPYEIRETLTREPSVWSEPDVGWDMR